MALQRRLPNVEVMKLLIKKFGVDTNEQGLEKAWVDGGYKMVATENALSYATYGKEWWQFHQALPYLIMKGADLDIRDESGRTSLHKAIASDGSFGKDAVRALVAAGAEVNAVDKKRQSCLDCAAHDPDIVGLLMNNGAKLTAAALFAAICAMNAQMVETILCNGIDSDTSLGSFDDIEEREDTGSPDNDTWKVSEDDPCTPLHYAAVNMAQSRCHEIHVQAAHSVNSLSSIVNSLLNHGADIFQKSSRRRFSKRQSKGFKLNSTKSTNDYKEYRVLHDIFIQGVPPENFLSLTKLDVNYRDANGRTLLHAACLSCLGLHYVLGPHRNEDAEEGPTVFKRLLAYGADLRA
jgi:hypothetical protein